MARAHGSEMPLYIISIETQLRRMRKIQQMPTQKKICKYLGKQIILINIVYFRFDNRYFRINVTAAKSQADNNK